MPRPTKNARLSKLLSLSEEFIKAGDKEAAVALMSVARSIMSREREKVTGKKPIIDFRRRERDLERKEQEANNRAWLKAEAAEVAEAAVGKQ